MDKMLTDLIKIFNYFFTKVERASWLRWLMRCIKGLPGEDWQRKDRLRIPIYSLGAFLIIGMIWALLTVPLQMRHRLSFLEGLIFALIQASCVCNAALFGHNRVVVRGWESGRKHINALNYLLMYCFYLVLLSGGQFFHPVLGWLMALCPTLWTLTQESKRIVRYPENINTRFKICTIDEAYKERHFYTQNTGYAYAGLYVSPEYATTHFAWIGAIGTGKTTMLLDYVETVLRDVYLKEYSLVLFNPQQDFFQKLQRLAPNVPVIISNPFDARCQAWEMWKDFSSISSADHIASMLFPEPNDGKSNSKFFSDAARAVLKGIIRVFIGRKSPWTLRDLVLLASEGNEVIRPFLDTNAMAKIAAAAVQRGETGDSVLATICVELTKFDVVAALLHHHQMSGRTFSMSDLKGKTLLVGWRHSKSASLQPYNRLLFGYLNSVTLDNSERYDEPHTFIVIDEFHQLGKIQDFETIAAMGRTKGISFGIAFQSIDQLKKIYGENETNVILGEISNKTYFGCDHSTAQWMAETVGRMDQVYKTKSFSESKSWGFDSTRTKGWTENLRVEFAILPQEFMYLGKPKESGTIRGYAKNDNMMWQFEIPIQKTPEVENAEPNFEPVHKDYEELIPWTQDDLRRLNIEDILKFEKC
jgi:hypothetical protein